jgi:hypothetical protein
MNKQLTPTELLLIGTIAICFLFIVVRLIYRIATGHFREDFLTPREAVDYYARGIPPQRPGAATAPRQNRRAWIILIVGCIIISIMVEVMSNFH